MFLYKKKHYKLDKMEKICCICGKEFENRSTDFCSRECACESSEELVLHTMPKND